MTIFPRVLIVNGEPPTTRNATGLTLHSLFRGWPAERLACLYLAERGPTPGTCGSAWRLRGSDMPFLRFAYGVLGKRWPDERAAPIEASGAGRDHASEAPLPHWTNNNRAWKHLKDLAGRHSLVQLARYELPRAVVEGIEAFQPQVIYTMLGSNSVLRLVLDVRARVPVPIVPHIMDDWPSTLYRQSILRPILRTRMRRDWRHVLDHAPERLTIGPAMAEEYARRYGGVFTPFMNAVERSWLEQADSAPPAPPPVVFTYVGGLHLNRWRSLREIAVALEALREEGLEAELHVYTQQRFAEEAKRLDIPGVVRLKGSLAPGDVPGALRAAHVVVHVESFDADSRLYTRYSVSTKIPECMASRRPMLAYGPGEVASVAYVDAVGAGLTVGTRDPDALKDRLRQLIRSGTLRRELGEKGYAAAASHHDADQQRAQFRSVLAAAAARRSLSAADGARSDRASA